MPLKISRPTSDMKKIQEFYTTEIGVTQVYYKEYPDQSKHAIFVFDEPADVGV